MLSICWNKYFSNMQQIESQAISSILNQLNQTKDGEVAVSFSGGKDSLVVLDLAVRAGVSNAVFCDTTLEFDETVAYVKKIKTYYGIDIEIVRSELDFFNLIKKIGLPSRRARWCCDVFKFAPITEYGKKKGIRVFVTGLRTAESNRRKLYSVIDKNPMMSFVQFNPLLRWSDEEIWEYIKSYNLPYHPLYDKGFKRIGCWCCPYNSSNDWVLLESMFPKKMSEFEQVMNEQANMIKIADKDRYINKKGWTAWISPMRRISVGKIDECKKNIRVDVGVYNIEFMGKIEENIKKVTNILPVLTDTFWVTENGTIKIILDRGKKRKLKMLIEKAINCVSCGVCISLCPVSALKIKNDSIIVNEETCVQCGVCINGSSQVLRGSCIVRNYGFRPASMIDFT